MFTFQNIKLFRFFIKKRAKKKYYIVVSGWDHEDRFSSKLQKAFNLFGTSSDESGSNYPIVTSAAWQKLNRTELQKDLNFPRHKRSCGVDIKHNPYIQIQI